MFDNEHGVFVTITQSLHVNRFKYEILVSSLLDDRWGVKHIATLNLQDQLPPIEIAAVTCPKQGLFNMRIDPSLLVEP